LTQCGPKSIVHQAECRQCTEAAAPTPIQGGRYGEEPSLTDLDDGDLKGTMDFRDIYHELPAKTLVTDPEPSVGPGRPDIGFLQSPLAR
jgi:hypothetical protein